MLFGMVFAEGRCVWLLAALPFAAAGCNGDPRDAGSDRVEPARQQGLRALLGGDGLRLGARDPVTGFAKADRPIDFSFPRDHGPHPAFRSEWWYLTAVLSNAEGREFGVQFTVFRRAIAPVDDSSVQSGTKKGAQAWRSGQVYLGHLAVSDVAARRHLHEERLARGHPALAGARAAPFAVHLEGWRLATEGDAAAGFWPLRLEAEATGFAVDLTLRGGKPIVRQGEGGLSRKGPNNASYYYSIPRIDAQGEVRVGGETHRVAGGAWLDREWSTSVLAAEYAGWDWFALRLDDGRDLMFYRMRRRDGQPSGYDSGVLIDADGNARALQGRDFSLEPLEHWREWPVAWRLYLPGESPPWSVRAAFADQVMDTSIRYWEGVAHVHDGAGNRLGAGYMELTGY